MPWRTATTSRTSTPTSISQTGCLRPPRPEMRTAGRFLLVLGLLYAFLTAVEMLGEGLSTLGADATDQLFRGISNPLVGLFVGILATAVVQSSSLTTATV